MSNPSTLIKSRYRQIIFPLHWRFSKYICLIFGLKTRGKKIISQLNEAELENLATLGKGVYTTANYRDNDTHILLDAIEKNMPTNTIEKNPVRVWHERFYIPLFFIIPLLLYRFKQNSV